MQNTEREGFDGLVMALAATFRVEASAALKLGYWIGLRGLTLLEVQMAATKALTECKSMPTPRDLRDMAGVVSVAGKALLAWNSVKQAIREQGAYRSVEFSDPVVNATVRTLGGWAHLCATESEELDKWTSKDFQRVYRELSGLPLGRNLTQHLPGVHEASGLHTLRAAPVTIETGTAEIPKQISGGSRAILSLR